MEIEGKINGQIKQGFMVLVGITNDDNEEIVDKMVNKLINLRIFEDENEKLNLSLMDIKGEILSISQFTLYANCKKGRRPSFLDAAKPEISKPLYEYFNQALENAGVHTEQQSSWTVKKSYSHKAKKRSVKIVSFNHDKKIRIKKQRYKGRKRVKERKK